MEVWGVGLSTRMANFKDISSTPISNVLCENSAPYENYDEVQGVLASQSKSFSTKKLFVASEAMSWPAATMVNGRTIPLIRRNLSSLFEGCLVTDQHMFHRAVCQFTPCCIVSQLRDLSRRFLDIVEESQELVPPPFITLRERLTSTLELHNHLLDCDFDQCILKMICLLW